MSVPSTRIGRIAGAERRRLQHGILKLLADLGGAFEGTFATFAQRLKNTHKGVLPFESVPVTQRQLAVLEGLKAIRAERGQTSDPMLRSRGFVGHVVTSMKLLEEGRRMITELSTSLRAEEASPPRVTASTASPSLPEKSGTQPDAESDLPTRRREAIVAFLERHGGSCKLTELRDQFVGEAPGLYPSKDAFYNHMDRLEELGVIATTAINPPNVRLGKMVRLVVDGVVPAMAAPPAHKEPPKARPAASVSPSAHRRLITKDELKVKISECNAERKRLNDALGATRDREKRLRALLDTYDDLVGNIADLIVENEQ